ncbi:hypothetical protein ACIQPR_09005 [Streptomyces sp. NPDC091280]|uniref:hypothetical protein n=1 Tax=Streptomyces sp. NPDC091280 TaxID=3365984 RepID=UPI00381893BA
MPESTSPTTDLTSQYIAQVTGDLERNLKEQERVGAEITVLQAQLADLEQDHAVLVNMRQALGVSDVPNGPSAAPASPAASAPQQPAKAKPRGRQRTQKTTAPSGTTAKRKPATAVAATAKTLQPTLVALIRQHLIDQSEPRSAAEISMALSQAHPDRDIKTKVVRLTLEGLVAKSQAQRTKQGNSVFYTRLDEPEQASVVPAEAQPEDTEN